jgi:MoaA/NifB/PqqE/SkfB family radical SAM enzyme
MNTLSILYRGPLSSCNYACPYCPFAKHKESRAEHEKDRLALERFETWVAAQSRPIRVLFTPWGEALVRVRYQRAMKQLASLEHVERVAIQTNLSAKLDWLSDCQADKIAFWATYHPGQTSRSRFLKKVSQLEALKVRFSVGVVGLREHLPEIETLRAALPDHVYLWVNAYDRRGPNYYSPSDLQRLEQIDSLFALNLRRHKSRGQDCRAGESAIAVNGDGTMRRCHFIDSPIGNIYNKDWETALQPRACTRAYCDCHIGYVHKPKLEPWNLDLYDVFADGVLERIPKNFSAKEILFPL